MLSRSVLLRSVALAFLVGQGATGQTLQDALISAYRTNPQLEADRARQRATDEDVSRAWGGYRPQVIVSGQAGQAQDRVWVPEQGFTGVQIVKEHDFRRPNEEAVQVKQEVWDGNRTQSDVIHSKWSVANGRAILTSTEQTVLGSAVQAYYDLYRDQRILDIQKQFVAALEDEKKAAIARYGVKDVTRTDVAQSEARLARGIADLRQYEGNLETSRSAFLTAVGIEPGHLAEFPPLPTNLLPKNIDDALARVEENPDLRASIFAEKAAETDIETLEATMRPDLSLQAVGTHNQHVDYTQTQTSSAQVELVLTVPLYDGGIASARTRAAKHTFGQRRLTTDLQRIRVADAIRRGWEGLQSNLARIKALEENLRADQVALDGVHQELKVGSRTVLDELNARQELLDAQVGLLRSQHDAALSAYSLLLACGQLTAKDLHLPIDLYDATDHYDSATWMPWGVWIDKDYPEPTAVRSGDLPGGNPYPYIPFINDDD